MARSKDCITVDLHGLTTSEAKRRLEWEIYKAPQQIKRVIVIHGSNNGTALRDMVRRTKWAGRVYEVVASFANDGETTLYLR